MEIEAYKYAKKNETLFEKVPIVHYKNGTVREGIHMVWLFDMFSGTSTGSLLSSALALKSNGTNIHENDDFKGKNIP
jgi:patatin-like phospholipase/acyl hydrolase